MLQKVVQWLTQGSFRFQKITESQAAFRLKDFQSCFNIMCNTMWTLWKFALTLSYKTEIVDLVRKISHVSILCETHCEISELTCSSDFM